MRFEFVTATRIVFGPGTIVEAGAIAANFGRNALVVIGRNAARAQRLLDSLREKSISFVLFSVEGEPDIDVIRRGAAKAKENKCDMVISIGGGSVLDSGKAIAAMMTNGGDILDYLEVIGGAKALSCPPAPFIAIPTTAGTGSEVTRNAVFSSPEHRIKVSMRSPMMLAKVALVDPELTWDLPPAVTASAGLDALTQVIEPYVSAKANPMTDSVCVEGIKRAARSLREAYLNGHNAAAREDMAVASLFGGMALTNSGLGAVHGFAGVIGGMFDAPHGAICAALLPHVMATNLSALRARESANSALPRYDVVAQLLTGQNTATADEGIAWIAQLVNDLKIPKLGTYGIQSEHYAEIVEKSKGTSSMKANAITLTAAELVAVLDKST